MQITITPRPDCKACKGGGLLQGDRVPYGSTSAQLPDDYCDCVIEQLPTDDNDYDIELKLADEVIQRAEAAVKAEAEFFQRMEDADRATAMTNVLTAAFDDDETAGKLMLIALGDDQRKRMLQAVECVADWIAQLEGWYEPLTASEVEKRVRQRSSDPLLSHLRKELGRE